MIFSPPALSWLKAYFRHDEINLFTCAKTFQLGFVVLLTFIVSLSLGCGGGTSGTGVKEFEGSLTTLDGEAVVGAKITLVESGTTVTTDEQGQFSLSGDLPAGEVALQIETNGVKNTVTIAQLPKGQAAVNVELQVNQESSSVTATHVSITPSGSSPSKPRQDNSPGNTGISSPGNTGISGTPQDPGVTGGSLPPDDTISSGDPGSTGISVTPGSPGTSGGSDDDASSGGSQVSGGSQGTASGGA